MSLEDECKFLHDIANPMSVARGNLKIVLRNLENYPELALGDPALAVHLGKALAAMEVMIKLLMDRRGILNLSEIQKDNLTSLD